VVNRVIPPQYFTKKTCPCEEAQRSNLSADKGRSAMLPTKLFFKFFLVLDLERGCRSNQRGGLVNEKIYDIDLFFKKNQYHIFFRLLNHFCH
jgi:hypothetical protein